jgi:beta-fructofuranosidase
MKSRRWLAGVLLSWCAWGHAREDVVLADFTTESYAPWQTTGVAFGDGPVRHVGPSETRVASSDRRAQNGKGIEGTLTSPEFVIDRDYVNLHLAGGDHAFRAAVSMWVGGKVVRSSTGGGNANLHWVTWDVREFRGQQAWLGVYDFCSEETMDYVAVERIESSDLARSTPSGDVESAIAAVRLDAVNAIKANTERARADPYRPVFHYTPPAQRMNDPNGPAWANGYHHVFYQHMVFVEHGPATNVHWGHARSRDLVNWETLPLAMHPAYELGELSCFSGNIAWDKHGEPVQFVTMVPYKRGTFRQIWPARPLDEEWIRWERVAAAPPHGLVPKGNPDRNLKDAFPFSTGDRRFLVLTDKTIPFYEAMDDRLTRWEYRGTLDADSAECPNFFEVDGHWLYLSSPHAPVHYQVGTFDPVTATFTERAKGLINHDLGFYASTAYRDNQGRTILLGVTRGQKSGQGWTGALALPRVLSIGADGLPRMHPLPELAALRREKINVPTPISLSDQRQLIEGLEGDTLEIIARFRVADAKAVGLNVRRSDDGKRFLKVGWEDGRIIAIKDTPKFPCRYELDETTGELVLHLFLDKGILDLATGDGRVFESRINYTPLEDLKVEVYAERGAATLLSLEAWELAPATINHSRLFQSAAAAGIHP